MCVSRRGGTFDFSSVLYRGRKRVIIEVEKGEAEEITGPSETTSTKIPTEIPEHGEIGRRSDRIIPRERRVAS